MCCQLRFPTVPHARWEHSWQAADAAAAAAQSRSAITGLFSCPLLALPTWLITRTPSASVKGRSSGCSGIAPPLPPKLTTPSSPTCTHREQN